MYALGDSEATKSTVESVEIRGAVKWFNVVKGYGFLTPEDGSPDVFLHLTVLRQAGYERVPPGAMVRCEAVRGAKGMQVLRVLEEQRFTPVGSGNGLTVDVRVIAATNKHLDEEILKGNFREDLFYRLNVIPFYVPPLREHAEDIPVLADHFLSEFARAYGRRPKRFSDSAAELLCRYRWPGNVRELRNLVERMVIMVGGDRIEARHLPPSLHRDSTRAAAGRVTHGGFSSLQEARAAYEREYILRKLEENQGNVSRTAEVLGLERSHLYRKMKTLGIAVGE